MARITCKDVEDACVRLSNGSYNKYKPVFANGYVSINMCIGSGLMVVRGGLSMREAYECVQAMITYNYYENRYCGKGDENE